MSARVVLNQARALFWRDLLTDLRHRLIYLVLVAEAALALVSYSFLARVFGETRPDGYEPLAFLLVGVALNDSLTTSIVYLAQGVRSNQQAGTLKAILAMPISAVRLMWLSMPYPSVRAVIDFLLFLGVAVALGLPLATINAAGTVVVFALAVLAMTGPAVVSAALAVAFKRGDPVRWALASVTWLLSGVLYPTDVMPAFLQAIAWLLPTTHALTAIRATIIGGESLASVTSEITVLAGFAVIGIPLSLWMFKLAVDYARREGTIGHS
jgi:ABC-2 type transport system permease protein